MVFKSSELNRTRERVLKRRRIFLFSFLGAVVLIILFLSLYQFTDVFSRVSEDLQSSPKSGDWVMFRYNMSHTGSPDPGGVTPRGEVKWTYKTDGPINSSPAAVDGIVYVGSRDRHVYAFKAETGEKLWEFKTGSWVESSPV